IFRHSDIPTAHWGDFEMRDVSHFVIYVTNASWARSTILPFASIPALCYKDASLVCSACKETRYCSCVTKCTSPVSHVFVCLNVSHSSAECQQAAWKHHKIGCKIQQQLNVVNAEMAAKPRARPAKNRCTGCNERGRDFYSCDECGYQACESCESDSSNGAHRMRFRPVIPGREDVAHTSLRPGTCYSRDGTTVTVQNMVLICAVSVCTCYCAGSNFGNKYCELEPKWYHGNGRGKSYNGDRHPEGYGDFPEEMYEAEERECNNCGKVTRVFKKEYCM
ncbi:hypothetical protein A0H81_08513, partial [Grifola frondosa]